MLGSFVLVVVAFCAWWRWRPFRVEVDGPSMRPALEPGDWALAIRSPRVRRGHVVVVEHPERVGFELVKRVTAVGGERAPDGRMLDVGEIWIEGDDAGASTDSRGFGPVRERSVAARVVVVWWPPRRWGIVQVTRA